MIFYLLEKIKKDKFAIFYASFVIAFTFAIFPGNFKTFFLFSLLCLAVMYWLSCDLFFSLFSIFLLSTLGVLPGKDYIFQIISSEKYHYLLFPNGIFTYMGINLSDIFLYWLVLFFLTKLLQKIVKTRFMRVKFKDGAGKNASLMSISFSSNLIMASFISWFLYLLINISVSLNKSIFPSYSLYLTFQQFKAMIFMPFVLYLFFSKPKFVFPFYLIIAALLTFQSLVGISQFFKFSRTIASQSYSISYNDPEEDLLIGRINGVSYSPNEHAYTILGLFCLLIPFLFLQSKNTLALASLIVSSIVNIVLSQSRASWIALVFLMINFRFFYTEFFTKMINIFKESQLYRLLAIFLVVIILSVVVPRIYLSKYALTQGGGGELRWEMIKEGVQIIRTSPFWGSGLGTSVTAALDAFPRGYAYSFPFAFHMVYLIVAVESGLPALLLFFVPFYLVMRNFLIMKKKMFLSKEIYLIYFSSFCYLTCTMVIFLFQPIQDRMIGIAVGVGLASYVKTIQEKKSFKKTETTYFKGS
jgi:hypothetical protein